MDMWPGTPILRVLRRRGPRRLFFGAVAACGWYVWVFLFILRTQNHYPNSELGSEKAPADFYCPFFLISVVQAKVFVAGAAAYAPQSYREAVVLSCCGVAALWLLLFAALRPVCSVRLLRWVYVGAMAFALGVVAAAGVIAAVA
mmetsp:Transcript_51041/g.134480  ORF Transcript_51041/g.134480 Transcript_51041/m.134480 type:complete len:144 (+) Transcript_51041:668-1099(+)